MISEWCNTCDPQYLSVIDKGTRNTLFVWIFIMMNENMFISRSLLYILTSDFLGFLVLGSRCCNYLLTPPLLSAGCGSGSSVIVFSPKCDSINGAN